MTLPHDPLALPRLEGLTLRHDPLAVPARPSAAAPAPRWWAPLLPIGEPSPGGVTVWHPAFAGMRGAELAADAPVPVDVDGAPIPLTWHTLVAGGDAGPVQHLGRVTAAWLEGGVLHAGGTVDLAAAGMAQAVAKFARDQLEGAPPMSLKATFTGLTYPERDGMPDYYSVTGWRLRGVELGRHAAAGWASPVGDVRWIGEGDPVPAALAAAPS